MQYILTHEEFTALKRKQEIEIKYEKNKLQELCSQIADTMPILYWNNTEPDTWGCILTKNNEYCDECPVEEICPYFDKRYSK